MSGGAASPKTLAERLTARAHECNPRFDEPVRLAEVFTAFDAFTRNFQVRG